MTGEVIKELYPEYYDTFVQLENRTGNVFWQYDRHIEKMV